MEPLQLFKENKDTNLCTHTVMDKFGDLHIVEMDNIL